MEHHTCATGFVAEQAGALRAHDQWIVGFGLTDKEELIHRKLMSLNTTSGEVAYLTTPSHAVLRTTPQGGEVVAREELFPGYFLLGVTSEHPHWQDMQSNVEEIFSILTTAGHRSAAFLRRREIEHIVNLIEQSPFGAQGHGFQVGHHVVVEDGAFRGLGGLVTELRGRTRLKVDIEIRGRVIPAVFQASSVRLEGQTAPEPPGPPKEVSP